MGLKLKLFFLGVTQVQKIRKALEKVGKKHFPLKDIGGLKVTKYITHKYCEHTTEAVY